MQGDNKRTPEYFALKELSSPVVFKPGKDQDIKKCLPLDEAAIQQYMKHEAIVETYWADVRCLDPKTNKPLQISAGALNWTSIDNLGDIEATYTASLGNNRANMPSEVKLQMRIAMESCDLGTSDFLVHSVCIAYFHRGQQWQVTSGVCGSHCVCIAPNGTRSSVLHCLGSTCHCRQLSDVTHACMLQDHCRRASQWS